MNLIASPTVPSPAEEVVARMQGLANDGLNAVHQAVQQTWKLLWEDEDPEVRAAKLAVMGPNATAAFLQHARTVQFLTDSGVAVAAQFTAPAVPLEFHPDGTVTLATPVEPQPS